MASNSPVITNPAVIVNNVNVAIVANSFEYTPGAGEAKLVVQTTGGGTVAPIYVEDAAKKMSTFKFSLLATPDNISLTAAWRSNSNLNVVAIADALSGFTVTFALAAITNDYAIKLGADNNTIDLEWQSLPGV